MWWKGAKNILVGQSQPGGHSGTNRRCIRHMVWGLSQAVGRETGRKTNKWGGKRTQVRKYWGRSVQLNGENGQRVQNGVPKEWNSGDNKGKIGKELPNDQKNPGPRNKTSLAPAEQCKLNTKKVQKRSARRFKTSGRDQNRGGGPAKKNGSDGGSPILKDAQFKVKKVEKRKV